MPKRKKASDVYFIDKIVDERIHDVYLHPIFLDWFFIFFMIIVQSTRVR